MHADPIPISHSPPWWSRPHVSVTWHTWQTFQHMLLPRPQESDKAFTNQISSTPFSPDFSALLNSQNTQTCRSGFASPMKPWPVYSTCSLLHVSTLSPSPTQRAPAVEWGHYMIRGDIDVCTHNGAYWRRNARGLGKVHMTPILQGSCKS